MLLQECNDLMIHTKGRFSAPSPLLQDAIDPRCLLLLTAMSNFSFVRVDGSWSRRHPSFRGSTRSRTTNGFSSNLVKVKSRNTSGCKAWWIFTCPSRPFVQFNHSLFVLCCADVQRCDMKTRQLLIKSKSKNDQEHIDGMMRMKTRSKKSERSNQARYDNPAQQTLFSTSESVTQVFQDVD